MNIYMVNLYLKKVNVVYKLCGLLIFLGICKQGGFLIIGEIDKKKFYKIQMCVFLVIFKRVGWLW